MHPRPVHSSLRRTSDQLHGTLPWKEQAAKDPPVTTAAYALEQAAKDPPVTTAAYALEQAAKDPPVTMAAKDPPVTTAAYALEHDPLHTD